MNNDPARNNCNAPEEEETEKDPDEVRSIAGCTRCCCDVVLLVVRAPSSRVRITATPPSTTFSSAEQRLKAHLRLWVRRLQCQDTAEVRLPTSSSTRGKKRPLHEQEYIQVRGGSGESGGSWRGEM